MSSDAPGISFGSSATPSSANAAADTRPGNGVYVPPVPNWLQVNNKPPESSFQSPRFDEVPMTGRSVATESHAPLLSTRSEATPNGKVASELHTPGPTPRQNPKEGLVDERQSELWYEGTYLGTLKHGKGVLRMAGCRYEGDFLNDMKHGDGSLIWDDGRRYCGQFVCDVFEGEAVMHWPDGRLYVGQYFEDKKHGDGTFTWQDGRRYQGKWIAGKRHGIGIYTNAKGFTRRGLWHFDRPVQWDDPATLQGADAQAVDDAAAAANLARRIASLSGGRAGNLSAQATERHPGLVEVSTL